MFPRWPDWVGVAVPAGECFPVAAIGPPGKQFYLNCITHDTEATGKHSLAAENVSPSLGFPECFPVAGIATTGKHSTRPGIIEETGKHFRGQLCFPVALIHLVAVG